MRSVKSRTFFYFREDGRITKALHTPRGLGVRNLGGSSETLTERVAELIPRDVLEREDVIQIICMTLLSGSLTWRKFTENKTAVLREAKRIMLYNGTLSDMAFVSLNQPLGSDQDIEFGDFLHS